MRVSNKLASLDASFIYFAFSRKMQSASCRYKRYACQLTYRLFIQLYLYGMDHLDIYAWTYIIEQQGNFIVASNFIGRFKF